MENFQHLPSKFDPTLEDPRWIPRDDDPPPASLAYEDYHKAKDALNRILMYRGFAVVIDQINRNKPSGRVFHPVVTSCTLRCSCGRAYVNKGRGLRKRQRTHMTECEWKGRLRRGKDNYGETVWYFTVQTPHHNHPRARGKLANFHARKRDEATLARIESQWKNRDTASKIVTDLLNADTNIKHSDVCNEIQKLRRKDMAGRSMIECLLNFLDAFETADGVKYWYKVDFDAQHRVRHLFFVHPESFSIVKANHDCIQIDATYKSNKFGMPLLHAVGVTSCNKTFDIAYSFMCGEEAIHCTWHMVAMKECLDELGVVPRCFITDFDRSLKAALRVVYPNVMQRLCIWHISMKVLAKAVQCWDITSTMSDEEKAAVDVD